MRIGLGDIGDEGTAEEAVVAPLREGKGAPRFVQTGVLVQSLHCIQDGHL